VIIPIQSGTYTTTGTTHYAEDVIQYGRSHFLIYKSKLHTCDTLFLFIKLFIYLLSLLLNSLFPLSVFYTDQNPIKVALNR